MPMNIDDEVENAAGRVDRAAEIRDQAGRQRDLAARARDEAGSRRDDDAEERDRRAHDRERQAELLRAGDEASAMFADDEGDPARASPATDRQQSRADRVAGAVDRHGAAGDRTASSDDRSASARDRHHASRDGLTGVYNRESGLLELDRDVARVLRTGHQLVLAFVDVDGLKAVNDAHGHAAGDKLLTDVAQSLTSALRPYDLVLRYGGDEFLCAVQGIGYADARPRFARVNHMLAATSGGGSVTIGLAELRRDERSKSLIARADADLYRQRAH